MTDEDRRERDRVEVPPADQPVLSHNDPAEGHARRLTRPPHPNLEIFDFELTDEQMAQVATLDSGASLFFDHRDPAMVTWLNSRAQA